MVLLSVWVLFGIGCAIAAANKNRSAVGWFFLGMLLGPFGLLFILLKSPLPASPSSISAPSLTPVLSSSEISLDQETKKCPACAETIKLEALKCRFCGETLDPQDVARQVEERRTALSDDLIKKAAGKMQCPFCLNWDVHKAIVHHGGYGDWCPHCKKALNFSQPGYL